MYEQPKPLSNRALEMIMRDVLDGIQELALGSALASGAGGCQIIDIRRTTPRPPRNDPREQVAEVVDLERYRRVAGG